MILAFMAGFFGFIAVMEAIALAMTVRERDILRQGYDDLKDQNQSLARTVAERWKV